MNLASIPSPSDGVWNLGPLPLRAYALAIILGIIVAIWVGERRFVARGGRPGTVSDVAVWAIPFGLVGARAYHVATNPEFYFGDGKDPVQALYVWEGGLGIWGAIAFGALGAYLGCRFSGVRFTSYIDAVAPGVVLAQAIGRWGNYFNQELMGEPTDRPWAVEIDFENRPEGYLEYQTFHPTFLYESLWCIGVAIVVILADRRWKLGRGRVFALYVALYTAGRAWIEDLRIDDAHEFGPFRLNVWVSLAIFVLAVAYFVVVGRRWPGREESVLRAGVGAGVASGGADPDDSPDDGDAGGGSDAEGEDEAGEQAEAEAEEKAEAEAEEKAEAEAEEKDKAEAEEKDKATAAAADEDETGTDGKDSTDGKAEAEAETRAETGADGEDSTDGKPAAEAEAEIGTDGEDSTDGKPAAEAETGTDGEDSTDGEPAAEAEASADGKSAAEAEAKTDADADADDSASDDATSDADRTDDADKDASKSGADGNANRSSAPASSETPSSSESTGSTSSSSSSGSSRSSWFDSSSDSYDASPSDY